MLCTLRCALRLLSMQCTNVSGIAGTRLLAQSALAMLSSLMPMKQSDPQWHAMTSSNIDHPVERSPMCRKRRNWWSRRRTLPAAPGGR